MRAIILGGPGSGKGTQSERLSNHLKIPVISTGDVLRNAIASKNFLGTKAKPYLEKGDLVPDELMIQFMRMRLLQPDVSEGWMLEGYPRTAFQAEELSFVLDDFKQRLDWAIYLELDEAVMVERSLARSRDDDQIEIVQRRIRRFKERTIPILEYYEPRQKLLRINANQTREQVEAEIIQKLGAS
ncbi:nucleoside monophosphate kinase [Lusitaniella coriacea LEGE 07157]|uniref:Adenylate kinase n=1 Tax=Lusitaniella coriacea LEGE 07157 TaxID=945747 RepID=A0A8J7DXH3_9CYAN|nr:nucleoside monophosphate kinase [Lusitaniella coriacea]MBE9116810.1 nucleoside monophosphate kinase [Lusitaniella coriacea LEGE 07157]